MPTIACRMYTDKTGLEPACVWSDTTRLPSSRSTCRTCVGYAVWHILLQIIPSNYTPHAHSARIAYRFEFARLRNANNTSVWPFCLSSGTHLVSCLVLLDACISVFCTHRRDGISQSIVCLVEQYSHTHLFDPILCFNTEMMRRVGVTSTTPRASFNIHCLESRRDCLERI